MFNLLPENLRNAIKKEYKLRLGIVIVGFIIVIQVSFLVFLFPSWLSSFYKEKDFSSRSEEANRSLSSLDISSTTAYIKSLNATLGIINTSLEYPKLVPIVDEILSRKASGVRVGGIYFTVSAVNLGVLSINGIADKRETLVAFAESLRRVEYFKKVDLPISNLAKDKNIEFTININIEK